MPKVAPPSTLEELRARAAALDGRTIAELARALSAEVPALRGRALHEKGKIGALLELTLGATGGSRARHDFPSLGVELKTLPVDARLRPRESTYLCTVSLVSAEHAEWATSWAREKLSHVLFVPVVERTHVLRPFFYRPTADDEAELRADFEWLTGRIGAGHIEDLTAHEGVHLQIRPKARDGSVRTIAWDRDGEPIATVPRGFYLRPTFTARLLARALGAPAGLTASGGGSEPGDPPR